MVEVIPAILPKTFSELTVALELLRGISSTVQLDVVDGVFAPNRTWPHGVGGQEEFQKIVSQDEGLPFWEEFDFEVDLMVRDARTEVQKWVDAGAARIVVHAKSNGAKEALQSLQHLRGEGKDLISLGVALSCDGSEEYEQFSGLVDFVQVMGIEKVGFQGQPFDERALTFIQNLRALHGDLKISVDGGVRMENIPSLVAAGANYLVVGSLILRSADVKTAIREILEVANHTLGS